MKFLVFFVSALVLVAHGNITPSDGENNVNDIQSEVIAGYAGQEAGGPQRVFTEDAPAVRVFGAEEEPSAGSPQEPQGAYAAEEPATDRVPAPESGVFIPIVSRVCTNAGCANVCYQLGYGYGVCISLDTCWCYN